ncbi:hypothetical protein AB1Y20_018366 [Prymnesium parvum]|uniref:Uncharacterized protein n=1 Tax=Prymnesium parvum TaxID=97485 RepID=A0AB34JRT1_PRYPA
MEELGVLKLAAQSDAILERKRCEDHAELHNVLASHAEARAAAAANLESKEAETCGLLFAFRRSNEYEPAEYRPVVVWAWRWSGG